MLRIRFITSVYYLYECIANLCLFYIVYIAEISSELYTWEYYETQIYRYLAGGEIVDKIRKAVSVRYKITNIYEIWQYKMMQYNPEIKRGGYFTEYINTFLKIK